MEGEKQLEVVFAVYDLASVTVRAHPIGMPGETTATKVTFAQPPSSAEDFGTLAVRWAQSAEITAALDS